MRNLQDDAAFADVPGCKDPAAACPLLRELQGVQSHTVPRCQVLEPGDIIDELGSSCSIVSISSSIIIIIISASRSFSMAG